MPRGDIRNAEHKFIYAWSDMADATPGIISPSDFDACWERFCHFMWFEGKGIGVPLSTGQRILIENLLRTLPDRRGLYLLAHHPDERRVIWPSRELTQLWLWWWEDGRKHVREVGVNGEGVVDLRPIFRAFFSNAELARHAEPRSPGALNPAAWALPDKPRLL